MWLSARVKLKVYSTRPAGEAFLCDVEQNPELGRSQPGPLWPTQLTHGHVYSFTKGRFATPLEHAAAQGIHISEACLGTSNPGTSSPSVGKHIVFACLSVCVCVFRNRV